MILMDIREEIKEACTHFNTERGKIYKLDLGYTTLFGTSITKLVEMIENEKFVQVSTGNIET